MNFRKSTARFTCRHILLSFLIEGVRTSLVAQWTGICLPMQGTQVRFLVQEDPTCHRATKPLHHNEESSLLTAVKRNPVVSDKDRVQPKNFKKFIIKKIKFTNKF